jgi:glucokinase
MKKLYLSIDLGGTSLRSALLDSEANILELNTVSSDEVREPSQLNLVIIREVQKLIPKSKDNSVVGLALGIPGLIDGQNGIIYQSPHFPLWKKVFLKEPLKNVFPFPIFMDNDANQAALGEAWKGAGKDWPHFVMLTLGTGIGGGILSEGKIFHGPLGFAGEVGHIIIDRNGLAGALGSRGTLETFCSQSGLRLHVKALQQEKIPLPQEILNLDGDSAHLPEELQQLALGGSKTARELWEDFGKALACGLASLGHLLGIFRFIIGGGLIGAWDLFYPSCLQEISKRLYETSAKHLEILPAKLGNKAGLIGGVKMIEEGLFIHE